MPINELIARGGIDPEMESRKMQNFLNAFRMGQGMVQNQQNAQQLEMEKERLGIQKQRETREQEEYLRKLKNEPWQDMATVISGIDVAASFLQPENHDSFVKFANTHGANKFIKIPTIAELEQKSMSDGVTNNGQFKAWYEQYKKKSLISLKTQAALLKAQAEGTKVVGAGGKLVDAAGNVIADNPKADAEKNLTLDQVIAQRVIKGELTLEQAMEMKRKTPEEKEVNMPAWYDAMGAQRLGKKYQTKTGRDEFADWVADPKNQKEVDAFQKKYTEQNTPKTVNVLQTGTGFRPYTSKGPGAGTMGEEIEGAGRPLPNEATSQLAVMKNTVDRINDLELRSKDLKGQFGPIDGRWTTLRQKLVANGPTQELLNEMSGLITMAYALSGKQISYQEMEMLKQAILPTINQPYQNFLATVNMSRKWLISQHNDTLQYYHDTGHTSKLKPLEEPNKNITVDPLGIR